MLTRTLRKCEGEMLFSRRKYDRRFCAPIDPRSVEISASYRLIEKRFDAAALYEIIGRRSTVWRERKNNRSACRDISAINNPREAAAISRRSRVSPAANDTASVQTRHDHTRVITGREARGGCFPRYAVTPPCVRPLRARDHPASVKHGSRYGNARGRLE